VGVGRRLFDLARANLNALLDRAAKAELEGLSEDELQAELERRKRERAAQEEDRQRRLAAEAAAGQRGQARAPHKPPPRRPPPRPPSKADVRALHLKTLGLGPGARLDQIKKAYRALMREHHPDKHASDPEKQKVASERAAQITAAYTELTKT
jgi:DnaJ-domain-containing protein 1